MWPSNPLTQRLNLRFPIMLAPMGIITTPALAAAVSNAGGLGGIGMWGLTAEEAARHIAGFRQLSPGSLNVNYPLWPEPTLLLRPARRCDGICSGITMQKAWGRYRKRKEW